MRTTRVAVDGTELEVLDLGAGDPVLFVQTGLTADELLPVARDPALSRFRRLLPHRRGYADSGPADGAGTIARDARDCVAVLDGLGLPAAHLVGYSYSGAVALELAGSAPERVLSLVLIEPPPIITPDPEDFRDVSSRLVDQSRREGAAAALAAFDEVVGSADWWAVVDRELPDARAQMERDARTFFEHDLPALLAWQFTADDAARVQAPVLHIGADGSGPWWDDVRRQVLAWFPGARDVQVKDADHGLVITHAAEVAGAISAFWGD